MQATSPFCFASGAISDITRLGEIISSLSRAQDRETIVEVIATQMWRATGFKSCAVVLCDDDSRPTRAWMCEGHKQFELAPSDLLPPISSALREALEAKRLVVNEHEADCAFANLIGATEAAPLGAMCVLVPGEYRHQNALLVRFLAEIVGAAMLRVEMTSMIGRLEQEALERNRLQLEHDTFVGMLGHDLRNPLGSIVMGAHVLKRSALDPDMTRAVDRILSSADRMRVMIAQMLDFAMSRVGGGIPIRPVQVDLKELCERIMGELQSGSYGPLRMLATGDLKGLWDGDRMEQVVSNLVGNALEHGTPRTSVQVSLDGSNRHVVTLAVRNEGAIPSSMLSRIFEPFAGSLSRPGGRRGTGLGLYITRLIIEAHGGTVSIRSSESDGTNVIIEVPREAAINGRLEH
jgi:signal transduction histidine kinase